MTAKVEENQLIKKIEADTVIAKLNDSVFSVLGNDKLVGFQKAYAVANAIEELKVLLTPAYMKPIMQLQGNKLGFKTDKDKDGGYPEAVVKNCLVEAVLMGVQPFGNQFNIIAGNTYITKEGFGYLLPRIPGLVFDIIPQLPRIKDQSAAVVMDIEWTINGVTKKKSIDFAIKVNNFMGTDAVIGKATRKARAWLFNTVNGTEIADGDVYDVDAKVVSTKINEDVSVEDLQLLFDMKKDALTPEELKSAQRIIDNKEAASYPKLLKTLQSK
jgi:hypothetical protein